MAEEEKKTTKKEEAKANYDLVEYPTQMGLAFRDNVTGNLLDDKQLLLQIANDVAFIKRNIA